MFVSHDIRNAQATAVLRLLFRRREGEWLSSMRLEFYRIFEASGYRLSD